MADTIAATTTADVELNPYDVVPYDSHAFDFTQPDRMHAIGRLFGMAPPDFRRARVLELGCAGGGNLVPLALRYPEARFTGIDLSAVEIEHAQALARETGAQNIDFRRMSITDIGPDLGTFDYIIAHGVFSWVPAPVRDAIVRVAKHNLAANGTALISYNTLPGWNQVRSIRDMMLYHCARFPTLEEKIAQGIALLRFVLDSAHSSLTAYRDSVQSELDLLTSQRAYYIFHEHLENENHSLHLHEMAAMVRGQGLEYLGDANLHIMYLNNFPETVAKTLVAFDDIVRIEQYLDFITNRRFRISLFCHQGVQLQRNLDAAAILDFHLGSRFLAPAPGTVDLSRDARTPFKLTNGVEVMAEQRYAAALMQVLATLGNRVVAAHDVIRDAARALGSGAEAERRVRDALIESGLRLVFSGGLVLHSDASSFATTVSERPIAFAAARAIAKRGDIVPSMVHMRLTLDTSARKLLQACDGTRDRAGLADVIVEGVVCGELAMHRDGRPVTDPAGARSEVGAWVEAMLQQFVRQGLLAG